LPFPFFLLPSQEVFVARPAVFLDRDGTITREVGYLRSPAQLRLLPRAASAIKRLNDGGFAVIVTSNQSGVARGLLTEADLALTNEALQRRLARHGARVDAFYFCPHHPEVGPPRYRRRCRCRKPSPGMLLRAARELGLDLRQSFSVGDSARDLLAGKRAGCRSILVRTGYGRATEAKLTGSPSPRYSGNSPLRLLASSTPRFPDHIADDLAEAVEWVLSRDWSRPFDHAQGEQECRSYGGPRKASRQECRSYGGRRRKPSRR
jgi:D-glycero-D-manno-heptose 1,7-bisphosphate phosphatase